MLPALAQTASMPSAPAPAGTAPAAPAGPSKVAVVMFEPAVAQTNEGQRDFAQLRTKYAPKEAALKTQSDEVDSLKKSLQSAGSTLSEAERASRAKTIDEKEKQLQRSAEEAQTDFNSEMNDIYQSLAQKVYNTVQTYAQQNGYTVVLDAGGNQQQPTVLWASESTNITAAVVAAYNAASGVPAQPNPAPPAKSPNTAPHTGGTKTPPSK